jgi:mannose-6-phosphate isomerase-like protein (cupin superfamily)
VRRERAKPYLLPAAATRRERAMLPFKLVADDSGGLISVCEFTLPGWSSGPVLHRHDAVDEGFFVVTGVLEFQLGDDRLVANAGDFAWVPRGTAHTFASASANPVHIVGFATPGGIEHLFAEQFEYLSALDGPPDPALMDEMGLRHGAPTLGPPITATNAPVLP